MKKTNLINFILFFIYSFPFFAAADVVNPFYPVADIPTELLENAHSVIRHQHTTFEVKSLDKAVMRYEIVVTLLSETSPYNDVVVHYDKSFHKVQMSDVKIYDKWGKLERKIKRKDLTDHSSNQGAGFDTGRFLHTDASSRNYPYTIAYQFEKSMSMTMFYPNWDIISTYNVAVENSAFTIKIPQNKTLRYHPQNIEIDPTISTEGEFTVYHFEKNNIPAFMAEPLSPRKEYLFPSVVFAPSQFKISNYKGDMTTWESLSRFNYHLNKGRDVLSPEMEKTVQRLVADANSKEEKIKILYRYLQENMRYVSVQLGVGGWQTFDAQYVEKNKFGDCKALSNFMKSILKAADIESYMALIRRGRDEGKQMADFSNSNFNHVLLYVPEVQDLNWLECTSSELPPGILGESNDDRYTLLVKPQGGELMRTPKSTKDDNTLHSNVTLKLDNEGAAQIIATQTAGAHQEEMYRYYAFNQSKDEQEQLLRKMLTLSNFNINEYSIAPSSEAYQTQIKLDLSIRKYASKAGKRLFFTPNAINQLNGVPRDLKNRQYPIENRSAFADTDIVTIELPTDYRVESIPEKQISIETDFGKYEVTVEEKDRQLIYKRYMERKAFHFPKERYEDYRTFMKAVAKADKMKVVLVRSVP